MSSAGTLYASAIEEVCNAPITDRIISFAAMKASSVIQCSPPPVLSSPVDHWRRVPQQPHHYLVTPPTTPTSSQHSHSVGARSVFLERQSSRCSKASAVPPLTVFIAQIIEKSRAQAPTLLAALVYLDRLQRRLPRAAKGMHCTCHRVFLAAFILAAKYTNDSSPKNKHWAWYAAVFSLAEVNLMEKQLLFLLDFDLRIDETDLLLQIWPFREQNAVAPVPWTAQYRPSSPLAVAYPELPMKRRKSVFELPAADVFAVVGRSARRYSIAGNAPSNQIAPTAGPAIFHPPLLAIKPPLRLFTARTESRASTPAAVLAMYPSPCNTIHAVESGCLSERGLAGCAAEDGGHACHVQVRAPLGCHGPPHAEYIPVRGDYCCKVDVCQQVASPFAARRQFVAGAGTFSCEPEVGPIAPPALSVRRARLFHDGQLQPPGTFPHQRSIL